MDFITSDIDSELEITPAEQLGDLILSNELDHKSLAKVLLNNEMNIEAPHNTTPPKRKRGRPKRANSFLQSNIVVTNTNPVKCDAEPETVKNGDTVHSDQPDNNNSVNVNGGDKPTISLVIANKSDASLKCETCGRQFVFPRSFHNHTIKCKAISVSNEDASDDFQSYKFRLYRKPSKKSYGEDGESGEEISEEPEMAQLAGPQDFSCDTCGKVFTSWKGLSLHMHKAKHLPDGNTHDMTKPHEKGISISSNVFTSNPMISKERNSDFVCNECDREFVEHDDLLQHMSKYHKRLRHERHCLRCHMPFLYSSTFEFHLC